MHDVLTNNFIFPNEQHVLWTLMIVLYPYITGLVAGAFIVSSLYHLFGKHELKPVGRLSLVISFCFLLFACVPLLVHLGHPERAFNIMITPNLNSAMSGFGFIYSFYMLIVVLEIWFIFREDIVQAYHQAVYDYDSTDIRTIIYFLLSLGVTEVTPKAKKIDYKISKILAGIGIPSACVLHGYVGFIFGALKSNPWWSTPLMPVIFLMSAIVSGIAMLIVLYMILMWIEKKPVDIPCIKVMVSYLWGFLLIDITLELLEILVMGYESLESWPIISALITQKLSFSFIIFQFIICTGIPLVILCAIILFNLKDKLIKSFSFLASVLLILQVLAMRWNVVVGGQLFSKSFRGLNDYYPALLEREGILPAIIIFSMPFVVYYIASKILPKILPDNHDDLQNTQ